MSEVHTHIPDRNLALELVRVTEAAALASGRWVGRGKKNEGDGAAVDAMRKLINSVQMNGVVVIGEGEKDEAPMLYNGEHVGTGGHGGYEGVELASGQDIVVIVIGLFIGPVTDGEHSRHVDNDRKYVPRLVCHSGHDLPFVWDRKTLYGE